MKNIFQILVISASGILSLMPRAGLSQTAKTFESSIKILEKIPQPMPDFRAVTYYKGLPDGYGNLRLGAGHSQNVSGFFNQMNGALPLYKSINDRLTTHTNVYEDTVLEEGKKVLDTIKNDFKENLNKFNNNTNKRIINQLLEYQKELVNAKNSRRLLDAVRKEASAEAYGVQAADSEWKECLLLLEKSELSTEREAVLAKIKKGTVFLKSVETATKAFATGGPMKAAEYIGGKVAETFIDSVNEILVEAFYSGTRETLAEIGTKIEAINLSLNDLACKKHSFELNQSKLNLEAKLTKVIVSYGEVLEHRSNAWKIIDLLGEEGSTDGRKFPFFVQLKKYNAQMNVMGKTVYDSINEYQTRLEKPPFSYGTNLYDYVKADLKKVNSEKLDTAEKNWTNVADNIVYYLGDYNRWYVNEKKQNESALIDLRSGKHLAFVDNMVAYSLKILGVTATYEYIIPN